MSTGASRQDILKARAVLLVDTFVVSLGEIVSFEGDGRLAVLEELTDVREQCVDGAEEQGEDAIEGLAVSILDSVIKYMEAT